MGASVIRRLAAEPVLPTRVRSILALTALLALTAIAAAVLTAVIVGAAWTALTRAG